jgi:hypothetical protein
LAYSSITDFLSDEYSSSEFKWNSRGKNKIPTAFLQTYHAKGVVIDKLNFREFVRIEGQF